MEKKQGIDVRKVITDILCDANGHGGGADLIVKFLKETLGNYLEGKTEEIELLKVERNSAIQSQKDSFEENMKTIKSHQNLIRKQREEISRLKGKVKEAHDYGFDKGWDHPNYGVSDSWEKFSKDNQIE